MHAKLLNGTHPFILFWIGLLTGAIIVALVFMVQQNRTLQNNLAPQGSPQTSVQEKKQAPQQKQKISTQEKKQFSKPLENHPTPTPL